jgi:hypothetical protein
MPIQKTRKQTVKGKKPTIKKSTRKNKDEKLKEMRDERLKEMRNQIDQLPIGAKRAVALQNYLQELKISPQQNLFLSFEHFFEIEKRIDTIDWKNWSSKFSMTDKLILKHVPSVKKILANHGCYLHVVVQPITERTPWGDYGWTDIEDKFGYEIFAIPFLIFELRLQNNEFLPLSKTKCVQHNMFTMDLFQLIQKKWPQATWSGNNKDAICFFKAAVNPVP